MRYKCATFSIVKFVDGCRCTEMESPKTSGLQRNLWPKVKKLQLRKRRCEVSIDPYMKSHSKKGNGDNLPFARLLPTTTYHWEQMASTYHQKAHEESWLQHITKKHMKNHVPVQPWVGFKKTQFWAWRDKNLPCFPVVVLQSSYWALNGSEKIQAWWILRLRGIERMTEAWGEGRERSEIGNMRTTQVVEKEP